MTRAETIERAIEQLPPGELTLYVAILECHKLAGS